MDVYIDVRGIKAADKKFNKFLELYKLCNEQGIKPPSEVVNFFEGKKYKDINKTGLVIDIGDEVECVGFEWEKNYYKKVCEMNVNSIPKDVIKLQFYIYG